MPQEALTEIKHRQRGGYYAEGVNRRNKVFYLGKA